MVQRPKWPEVMLVSLAGSMPRRIATPLLDEMLVHHWVTPPPPNQYVISTHLYTCVKRDKVE